MQMLLVLNLVMIVFNLLPAFPMDGGRVLRALLAGITGQRVAATRTAVLIGGGVAALFGALRRAGAAQPLAAGDCRVRSLGRLSRTASPGGRRA